MTNTAPFSCWGLGHQRGVDGRMYWQYELPFQSTRSANFYPRSPLTKRGRSNVFVCQTLVRFDIFRNEIDETMPVPPPEGVQVIAVSSSKLHCGEVYDCIFTPFDCDRYSGRESRRAGGVMVLWGEIAQLMVPEEGALILGLSNNHRVRSHHLILVRFCDLLVAKEDGYLIHLLSSNGS